MKQEIERKFLLRGDFRPFAHAALELAQGYLCSGSESTVRVRVQDQQGFLTIKGKSCAQGMSRMEWEREISLDDARKLLELCQPVVIRKTRHLVEFGGNLFEVDEFHGENQGLLVAEIELEQPEQAFSKPDWLGQEVTGDPRYYNSMLSKTPYTLW